MDHGKKTAEFASGAIPQYIPSGARDYSADAVVIQEFRREEQLELERGVPVRGTIA